MSANSLQLVPQTPLGVIRVQRAMERAFRDYTGSLRVQLWDGMAMSLGRSGPVVTLAVHSAKLLRELAWRADPLRLAEAYFSGEIDVEGDFYALLAQHTHIQSLTLRRRDRLALLFAALLSRGSSASELRDTATVRWTAPLQAPVSNTGSKARNRKAIAFHYDVSTEFYRLWLDDQMVYSCAYFDDSGDTLEQAQRNKLDHICRKLRLKAGEHLLDIGCGWGALICWAAQHYGVRAHGITLSRPQYEFTKSKIRDLGLEQQVTVDLRDYRDLPEEPAFDKVSSIGMFEHVGRKHLVTYFRAVRQALKPGGLFLNHGITLDAVSRHKTVGADFIQRYVFPDSELDLLSNVQQIMERNGFEICDVEGLRPHYALTLRHWVARLDLQRENALAHVSEARYRVWRLYMAASALQFEQGGLGVYQILAANRHAGRIDLPLTRRDLYQ